MDVWIIVEHNDAGDSILGVASSVDAAERYIHDSFSEWATVDWGEVEHQKENRWALTGQFSFVGENPTDRVSIFEMQRHELATDITAPSIRQA